MACARERVRRRRSRRRWRACAVRACGRRGGLPLLPTRERPVARVIACARSGCRIPMGDAGYAPGSRAQRADDARALLLGGGREALISRGVRHFGNAYVYFFAPLILRCVASPYDGPTGNLSFFSRPRACSTGRRFVGRVPGGVPSLWGGCPFASSVSGLLRAGGAPTPWDH